eukprot:s4226_g4.t2
MTGSQACSALCLLEDLVFGPGYPYVGLVALTFVSEPTVTFTTTPENSLGEGVISFLPLFANEQGENQFDRDVSWFSLWPVSALACRSMISPRHSHPKFCIALHKARSCEQRGQGENLNLMALCVYANTFNVSDVPGLIKPKQFQHVQKSAITSMARKIRDQWVRSVRALVACVLPTTLFGPTTFFGPKHSKYDAVCPVGYLRFRHHGRPFVAFTGATEAESLVRALMSGEDVTSLLPKRCSKEQEHPAV